MNRYIEDMYNQLTPLLQTQMTSAGGWVGDPFAWTYVGSAQFLVGTADIGGTADLTAHYPAGLKLAWTDGGGTLKYGYVASAAVTSGTTNVYLVPTPD